MIIIISMRQDEEFLFFPFTLTRRKRKKDGKGIENERVSIIKCIFRSPQVSWVRSRDAHLLGVDDVTFISDSRFKILKPEKPGDEWNLHIK